MYLDYSKINSKIKKQPMLRLRTLAGTELGPIPFVHDLSFKINYADVSEIEFTIPYMVDGKLNPMYGAVTGYKVVYTDTLGIYILTSPQKSGDGVGEEKTLRGYSLEQHFQTKKLYLEEGTYNFWNPANRTDTILERILELDPTWKIGYVAPRLIGCYRTFDEYDNDALSFCYGDAMEKYRCSFVFDVYTKTINVYDADDEAEILPIYLSYKNLVDTVGVDEISDEFATKLCVYGSDNLTIRDVNPIGTDYLVDLSYKTYTPKMYRRRGQYEGLADPENIEIKGGTAKGGRLVVINTTKPNPDGCIDGAKVTTGKNLPELVEFGQGYKFYSYDFPGRGKGYMKPRPFTAKTIQRLKESKAHIVALKAGLKRQGVKTQ